MKESEFKNSPALKESLRELHAIRAQIYREERGLTIEQRIEKTRRETQPIIEKYGLKVVE